MDAVTVHTDKKAAMEGSTTRESRRDTRADAGFFSLSAEELSDQLKALSEPTRLKIFDLLMQGVQCNCEIANRLDLSASLVSHHMQVLRRAGLVQGEHSPRDERWVFYSVDPSALEHLLVDMERLLNPARIQPRNPTCGP